MDTQIVPLTAGEIIPGPNDRQHFDVRALEELAASIHLHGLIQPISVRPVEGTDVYEIVAGERRFRACQHLGLTEIPCRILDADDEEASAIMLAENCARADLNPIEEASAYATRMERFGWTVQETAERAGVTPIRVRFRLKLLGLHADLQELVRMGHFPIGYAQILADASLDNNRQRFALRSLQDNPAPTPGWFRQVVSAQAALQSQEALFSEDILAEPGPLSDIPTDRTAPATLPPPAASDTVRETILSHIAHWTDAAAQWARLGKPFKRQECEAAATALRLVLATL